MSDLVPYGPQVRVDYFGASWCKSCLEKRPLVEQACKELEIVYEYHDIDDPIKKTRAQALGFKTIPAVAVWQRVDDRSEATLYRAHGGLINRPALEDAIRRAKERIDG